MKRTKNLLILSISIIILLSLYFILRDRPQEKSDNFQTATKTITLLDLEQKKITKIVLKSNNNLIRFERQNQQWTANFNFPLLQNEIENLANTFKGLNADQLIDKEPTDLEQYGLKHPAVTIEVTLANEKSPKIMYLGDLTPSGNYYFMLDNDPAVYTVTGYIGAKFKMNSAGFRDHTLSRIDTEKINYFMFSQPGKPVLEIKLDSTDSKLSRYGIGIWQMTKPYRDSITVATDKFQPILNTLSSITQAEKFIDDNPTDLSRYGLAKPQGELLIKDENTQFHLLIGKPMDEDYVYCKMSDSKSIFTLRRNDLAIMDTKPFELIDKFVFIPNIENVDRITLSGLGSNHTMTIERQKNADSKKDSEKFITSYKVNGKKVEEQLFKSIYQNLIGLLFEGECQGQPKDAVPDLRLTYQLDKGPKHQMDIKFIPYNYDFYAVSRNGITEFLISKDQVKKLLRELETFKINPGNDP